MLFLHNKFSWQYETLTLIALPTPEEFKLAIEEYESEAISYFTLIMSVTVVVSFLRRLS